MDLAKRLKHIRTSKKISVYKLAQMSGVSSTYIYEIEQEKKQPTVEIMFLICSALGITLSEFFADEPSEIPSDLIYLLKTAKELTPAQRLALQHFLETILP